MYNNYIITTIYNMYNYIYNYIHIKQLEKKYNCQITRKKREIITLYVKAVTSIGKAQKSRTKVTT